MITFKGKPVNFHYTFESFTRLDEECGINVFGLKKLEQLFTPARLRDVVWAGLLDQHPELSRQEVGKWITFENAGELMELATTALGEAMPKKGKK